MTPPTRGNGGGDAHGDAFHWRKRFHALALDRGC